MRAVRRAAPAGRRAPKRRWFAAFFAVLAAAALGAVEHGFVADKASPASGVIIQAAGLYLVFRGARRATERSWRGEVERDPEARSIR